MNSRRPEIRRLESVSSSGISRVLERWSQDGEKRKIRDEEAHLRLYRGDGNVTVGLHSLHYGQFHSSMGGSYTH